MRHVGNDLVLPYASATERGWTALAAVLAAGGVARSVPVGPSVEITAGPSGVALVVLDVLDPASGPDEPAGEWLELAALDELVEPAEVRAGVRRVQAEAAGTAARPPDRPDWFRFGWWAEMEAWVDARVAELGYVRRGPSVPVKLWSLSAVARIPVRDTVGRSSEVYFKATCDHFAAEPSITQALSRRWPDAVPGVLAIDAARAWMLMRPLPAAEEDRPTPQPQLAAATATVLAGLQLDSTAHLVELRTAGCPDRLGESMVTGLAGVIRDSRELPRLSAAERHQLLEIEPWLGAQVRALVACGLPWTLVHGDLHLGNAAFDDGQPILFDWTDACVSHPFLDGAHLAQSLPRPEDRSRVWAAFTEVWRAAYPSADVERATALADVVDLVFQVTTFDQIARATEAASQWELAGASARLLRRLLERYAAAPKT